jgi:maltooligosyltrehalose trehalohydrolase
MHCFKVWAPRAKKLTLKLGDDEVQMSGPDPQGWWTQEVADAGTGTDCAYKIDDDPRLYPDPRSQWQPNGVHGVSRVYDHSSFEWSDTGFRPPVLTSAIIYELHVGTFTPDGTLDSAIGRLDYLVDLGVTHIELMPVGAFAGDHGWGYDGVDLSAVHEPYGGPDGLKRFVNAAHGKGLAVLLDVVYNHFGPVGNYVGKFGPYILDSHRTPWGGAVNLEEAGSDQVRRFFCDNALMWLRDFHVDGLRLDAVHAFVDRSAIHFLEQLATEVEALASSLGRDMALIAESDLNDPRIVTPREAGGFGIAAQWSDDFQHALFAVLDPNPKLGYYTDFGELSHLAKAIQSTFVYDGIYSSYRRCIHGKAPRGLSQHKFVCCIQNHDQIGNRAVGDRLREIVGFDRAKVAATVVLLSPFIPLLFQGEEWAASSPFQYFADHEDPAMAKMVSEGRKNEFRSFGWDPNLIPDPEARATFERSKLNWGELAEADHAEMHRWYRELIRLRRNTPCLNNGEPGKACVQYDEQEKWFIMTRGGMTLICNLGDRARNFGARGGKPVRLSSREGIAVSGNTVALPPDTVAICL